MSDWKANEDLCHEILIPIRTLRAPAKHRIPDPVLARRDGRESHAAFREYPLKRLLDVVLATVALVVSLPLWGIIAAAIKLEDGGPIFYRQQRWGKGRVPVTVYKFRSMTFGPDSGNGSVQARANDPRITSVGRWLRATSLDELPQILNIWRGGMSWVGPRALPINEVQVNESDSVPDEGIPGFAMRCRVRPGLTGIAQIYAPRDVLRRRKFRYDCLYIRRQSLWLDLRLICLSFWITLRGRWEHRGKPTHDPGA